MSNVIEISGLRKEYKDFVLDDVSFSLPEGHIMGFVGQNGAGKTTTIRLILNMTGRKKGSVRIFGLDNILEESKIKQDIGAVFDEIYYVDTWKARDVEKVLKPFYAQWDSAAYARYLKSFGISMDKKVKELSRGMKLKLMRAVAMSHDAKLLILDEPTSGLDPVARDELLDILVAYVADGRKSVLFSTHITSDLERIANDVTLIDRGRIFHSGTKASLLDSYRIVKGGPKELTDALKARIIGLDRTGTGFSGLLRVSEAGKLPKGLILERPSIDEILVRINREVGNHA